MKVYDCFMYCGEKDLLEIRLNSLNTRVDYFVIVEAALTHRKNPKPLYLKELLDTDDPVIRNFKHKIRRVEVDISKYTKPWDGENAQRNALMEGITDADPKDLILISDADEIPDYHTLQYQKASEIELIVYRMPFFYYNFKWLKRFECHGTTGVQYRLLKDKSPQDYRNSRFTDNYIPWAGWHCSYFGTSEDIARKIRSIAHDEFDNPSFYDIKQVTNRIVNGIDIFDRPYPEDLVPTTKDIQLPEYVIQNKNRFSLYL